MARAVRDDLLERRGPAGGIQNRVGHLFDAGLYPAAHVVGLPQLSVGEHGLDGPAVVVDVQPLPTVLRRRVEGQRLIVEGLGREQRDDFFGELVRPVVVAAVGDGDWDPEGLHVGPDGMVGTGLGGVVGRTGPIGRLLGEYLVRVEGQVPVDLAGGYVMEPGHAVTSGSLGEGLGAEHVGPEESGRVEDGQAVVRLGGEVDHHVDLVLGQRLGHDLEITDVPLDEHDPILDISQIGPVPRIGEHVVGHHHVVGVVLHPVTHEVRADEAGPPGHE